MQLAPRVVRHAAGALVAGLVALSAHVVADDKWRLALDTLVYADTDHVAVVSPTTSVRYLLDDDGGELRARVGVDAVSAASVDLVGQATRGFTEARTQADLGVSKAFGDWLPSLDYRLSYEPDYFSNGGRAAVRTRIGSPDTVLQLGYGFTYDVVGRTGTLFQMNEGMVTHRADVSLTQVLDPETLLRGAVTLTAHAGYQSKPYRYVPMFDAASLSRAAADGVRLDLGNYADYAIVRVPEQTPYDRVGVAFAARVMRHLAALRGSLRIDAQIFVDTWGVLAGVLEPALTIGIDPEWSVVAYGRIYAQSSAWFWQRTYALDDSTQPGRVPQYRTLDRELSALENYTVGGRVEWRAPDQRFGLYADAALMVSNFDAFLYLDGRAALIAMGGLRWTP